MNKELISSLLMLRSFKNKYCLFILGIEISPHLSGNSICMTFTKSETIATKTSFNISNLEEIISTLFFYVDNLSAILKEKVATVKKTQIVRKTWVSLIMKKCSMTLKKLQETRINTIKLFRRFKNIVNKHLLSFRFELFKPLLVLLLKKRERCRNSLIVFQRLLKLNRKFNKG